MFDESVPHLADALQCAEMALRLIPKEKIDPRTIAALDTVKNYAIEKEKSSENVHTS